METNLFKKIALPSAEATQKLGEQFGRILSPGSVLFLIGDLGAGKTTFMQGLGKGLGIDDPIVSPTFTLVNEYLEGRLPLYHLDLYRLEPNQVSTLYPETYWEGMEVDPGITAIEWAQRLPYKPPSYLEIYLTPISEYSRHAHLNAANFADESLFQAISGWL